MKKLLNLADLIMMWQNDNIPLNEDNVAEQLSTTNQIHGKYLDINAAIKSDHLKSKIKLKEMYSKLERFYSGKSLENEEFDEYYAKKKLIKTEIASNILRHPDYVALEKLENELNVLDEAITSIMNQIQFNRCKNIKNYFDYVRFTNGI